MDKNKEVNLVYTIAETIKLLKLSRPSLMKLIEAGKLKTVRSCESTRSKILIKADSIWAFLEG